MGVQVGLWTHITFLKKLYSLFLWMRLSHLKGAVYFLTLTSQKYLAMKICENLENVFPGLWILLHPNTVLLFSLSQTFRQQTIKICVLRGSWENTFAFQFHGQILKVFQGSGSTSQARSRHFIKVWSEFSPPSKMVLLTSKLSIVLCCSETNNAVK